MIDRKELKLDARAAMRETRPSAVWVTLAIVAILLVLQVLSLILSGDLEAYRAMYENALNGQLAMVEATGSTSFFAWLLTLALDLMTMVVSVGYTLYTLRLHRRQSPSFGDVFDAFGIFFRAVWMSILRSIVVSLWAFVYVIPATLLSFLMPAQYALLIALPFLAPMFIASYAYSMADYIMLDHRELGCAQCLSLSRAAMRGHKWEQFKLRLSFLGWYILSIVPFVYLWVYPYTMTTIAGYYERVVPDFLQKLGSMTAAAPFAPDNTDAPSYHVPGGSPQTPEEPKEDEDEEGRS